MCPFIRSFKLNLKFQKRHLLIKFKLRSLVFILCNDLTAIFRLELVSFRSWAVAAIFHGTVNLKVYRVFFSAHNSFARSLHVAYCSNPFNRYFYNQTAILIHRTPSKMPYIICTISGAKLRARIIIRSLNLVSVHNCMRILGPR